MNRAEFVRMLRNSDTTGPMNSIMMTERVVNQVLDTLQRAIVEHGSLKIQGFGVFEVVDVPARQGRNPRTGESIPIPAHKAREVQAGQGTAGGGEPWTVTPSPTSD